MDRTFYIFEQRTIQYQWSTSGFFRSYPAKFYSIMLYEESGKFYELLTGQFLGSCKYDGNTKYVFSEEFGYSVPLSGYSVRRYAHVITAEEFAQKARIYMEDKGQILPHISKRFEQWRADYKKRMAEERSKQLAEEQKKRQDAQNVDWLSNMLNKRK